MKFSIKIAIIIISFSAFTKAQVGIGTNDPKGALHITSTQNLGVVLPQVTDLTTVTDGNGNPPVDGTMVFNIDLMMTCVYANSNWSCFGIDASGDAVVVDATPFIPGDASYDTRQTYVKASGSLTGHRFGHGVILSGDGETLAVGSRYEDVNGGYGAVYIFQMTPTGWVEQAKIQPSVKNNPDYFGYHFDLSNDGNTLGVGSFYENSGNPSDPNDSSMYQAGAAYVYRRSGTVWTQQAYIKAATPKISTFFGSGIAISSDGNRMAVASYRDNSSATGVGANQSLTDSADTGAVFIFDYIASSWTQTEFIKASNAESGDHFGNQICLSDDGLVLVVQANREDGSLAGINSGDDNLASNTGALYVYRGLSSSWTEEAIIRAPIVYDNGYFGSSISLSTTGDILLVSDVSDRSDATLINGTTTIQTNTDSGAAHLYRYNGSIWNYDTYFKAPNSELGDYFGISVDMSSDGNYVIIAAQNEGGSSTGTNGDFTDNSSPNSGAAYVYAFESGSYVYKQYVKALNTDSNDLFGYNISISAFTSPSAVSINDNGSVISCSSQNEGSNATTINGDQTNNTAGSSGAVYIYEDN